MGKSDITNIKDIELLVNSFYNIIRQDQLLGPIFNAVIKDGWDTHLEKMYTFWNTVLFSEPGYTGSPFPPHAKLPVEKYHFEHWVALFIQTVNDNFEGEKADEAIWRAERMAEMFNLKIEHIRKNGNLSII
ncbi:group III truncated hemoglobin [Solitalea sp. MAHUQ-68]|uniref:Group III truncated hemoglobin n=1 Tax=Solitalea agri TaxID=2953739 RepID=A0A9X2F0L8_9SPHI|nr:group III truncated hemoglobin [Solitalea agri]MCO4292422.1 group III truncated hemoglobin [Solitalea agri]